MDVLIRDVGHHDWHTLTQIFNHYVEHSPAAYPEEPVGETFFRNLHMSAPDYPFLVAEQTGQVRGFAYLSPFHGATTMRHTAVVTYFLHPKSTGAGIGTRMLHQLMEHGRDLGIRCYLAHISSLNEGSIRFHLTHGFEICGRFREVGFKHGAPFDMIWMQRIVT